MKLSTVFFTTVVATVLPGVSAASVSLRGILPEKDTSFVVGCNDPNYNCKHLDLNACKKEGNCSQCKDNNNNYYCYNKCDTEPSKCSSNNKSYSCSDFDDNKSKCNDKGCYYNKSSGKCSSNDNNKSYSCSDYNGNKSKCEGKNGCYYNKNNGKCKSSNLLLEESLKSDSAPVFPEDYKVQDSEDVDSELFDFE